MNDSVLTDQMLEQFRAIRAQLSRIEEEIRDIKAEARIDRTHIDALMQTGNLHGEQIASLDARLDRIEKRLDLVEAEPR